MLHTVSEATPLEPNSNYYKIEFTNQDPSVQSLIFTTVYQNDCLKGYFPSSVYTQIQVCVEGNVLHGLGSYRTSGQIWDPTNAAALDLDNMQTTGNCFSSKEIIFLFWKTGRIRMEFFWLLGKVYSPSPTRGFKMLQICHCTKKDLPSKCLEMQTGRYLAF